MLSGLLPLFISLKHLIPFFYKKKVLSQSGLTCDSQSILHVVAILHQNHHCIQRYLFSGSMYCTMFSFNVSDVLCEILQSTIPATTLDEKQITAYFTNYSFYGFQV